MRAKIMTIVLLLDFLNMTNVLPPWSQPRLFIWICLTLLPLFLILLKLSSAAFFQDAEILLGGAPAIASFQHSSSSTTDHSTARIAVTRSRRSDSIIPTKSPIGDAQDSSGVLGYVADPTALQRGRQAYLQSQNSNNNKDYWKAIQEYQSQWRVGVLYYGDTILSTEHICAFGPGRGIEEDYGYKLLKEKILIANEDAPTSSSPRLFCGIYTWSGMRDLTRTQALTWGYKCDGFLAFSNETIPDLGMVHLVHRGEESYQNMWQKTRSIWAYIYNHYLDDYDYFHLGGDDMYVLVENMRRFLRKFPRGNKLRHFGQWLPDKNMISGGPGYTLNAAALRRFVEEALPHCAATQKVSHEDRLVSKCLALIGILGNETDTRDVDSGEQQYHDANPSQLYTFRANQGRSYQSKIASHWEILPHPSRPNETVGSKHELDAAATYSVTFHNLFNPQYVARVHAILYRMCPLDSPLGIGMQQRHSIV